MKAGAARLGHQQGQVGTTHGRDRGTTGTGRTIDKDGIHPLRRRQPARLLTHLVHQLAGVLLPRCQSSVHHPPIAEGAGRPIAAVALDHADRARRAEARAETTSVASCFRNEITVIEETNRVEAASIHANLASWTA